MTSETITKESDSSGVYFRRVVHDANGNLVSDERIKKDPVLVFSQPETASLGTAESVSVTIAFHVWDFDGEPRIDSGEVHFRLWDREVADDEGVPFTRQLVDGELALVVEFDAPGRFVVTIEPPLIADIQFAEPVQIRVES